LQDFDRWSAQIESIPHNELAQIILEESGLIAMWKSEGTPDAEGRLENLKELVRSIGEFPNLGGFLEHVSLIMEVENADGGAKVSLMTLHAAKGLEFEIVFLPGWEEGLFPHQRSLDESGAAGLEEERRLAYVGLTRARRKAAIYYTANRMVRGLWQTSRESRFLSELPEDHVVSERSSGSRQWGYEVSRFDQVTFSGSQYSTPGWRRARDQIVDTGLFPEERRGVRGPNVKEGRAILRETALPTANAGARVMHSKFGPGQIFAVDGSKLTVDFDKAGRRMVLDTFVTLL
jgi:DNA helicase-2/ATP-dependent DNA helicase PcrA